MKPIYFTPSDFGGYTFFLMTSGLVFDLSFIGVFASFMCFLAAMTFYSRSNKEDKKEILIEE